MNRNDLRFIKTEENLKKTLLRLLEKSPIEKISIKELCSEAKCSRNAFYQHYQSKEELYCAILGDILNTIEKSTQPLMRDQSGMDEEKISEFTYRLLKIFHDYKEDFTSLMNGNEKFQIFLSDSLYCSFMCTYKSVAVSPPIPLQGELITRYFCGGIACFIEQWLKPSTITLEQAQLYLDTCSRDNFRKMRDLLIAP